MKKIIIVEDEEKLRNELKKFLETNGFEVFLITDFNDTENSIINTSGDLILLDINIPNINGEYLCKSIRKKISTPIVIVTSRNTEIDEIISFNNGADDFITKPYNSQVLLARINRILERQNPVSETLCYKNMIVDFTKSTISQDTKVVDLSRNEIKILFYLLKNKGKIVSRDEIMDFLWDDNEFVDDNTLTVNINRLRSKILSILDEDIIVTKRGLGYIIYEAN